VKPEKIEEIKMAGVMKPARGRGCEKRSTEVKIRVGEQRKRGHTERGAQRKKGIEGQREILIYI
jgi:hypothetical protein